MRDLHVISIRIAGIQIILVRIKRDPSEVDSTQRHEPSGEQHDLPQMFLHELLFLARVIRIRFKRLNSDEYKQGFAVH